MERLLIWICMGALVACSEPAPSGAGQGIAPDSPSSPAAEPPPASAPEAGGSEIVAPQTGDMAGEVAAGEPDQDQADTYVGTGNEPGWRVDIGADRIALSLDYGDRQLAGPLPAVAEPSDGGRRYQAELDGSAIQVDIQPGPCQDDMSGMPRPDRVRLQVDDRILHGCGGDPRDLFTGDEWRIVALDGQDIPDQQHGSLQFDRAERVSGRAFCNRFSASYALTGESLTIGPAAATKMACEADAMALEQRLLALLDQVTGFTIEDGHLALHTATDIALMARR